VKQPFPITLHVRVRFMTTRSNGSSEHLTRYRHSPPPGGKCCMTLTSPGRALPKRSGCVVYHLPDLELVVTHVTTDRSHSSRHHEAVPKSDLSGKRLWFLRDALAVGQRSARGHSSVAISLRRSMCSRCDWRKPPFASTPRLQLVRAYSAFSSPQFGVRSCAQARCPLSASEGEGAA
jgi:hypothetical protein